MDKKYITKNIQRAMKYVSQLLVPLENHYYHQYDHALETMERAVYLAKKEWLKHDEIEILALATLFHDTGFVIQYDNNEYIWAKIAENYLKSMLYPHEKIKLIEKIILSTSIKYNEPKNIFEKIIRDADLDNLWRNDFLSQSRNLKKELETIKNIKIKEPDWKHWSIHFLETHKYYTKTQKKERNKKKDENLLKIEKELSE